MIINLREAVQIGLQLSGLVIQIQISFSIIQLEEELKISITINHNQYHRLLKSQLKSLQRIKVKVMKKFPARLYVNKIHGL